MPLYPRTLQPAIEAELFKGKAIVLYGARQVGKTTLLRQILARTEAEASRGASADTRATAGGSTRYLNCDEPDVRAALAGRTSTELRALIGRPRILAIDEAQRVRDIGLTLKLLVDNLPDVQVIATGSSAFELSNTISEPLTGRKVEFQLYPLSVEERLGQEGLGHEGPSELEFSRRIESYLRFGAYPGVVGEDDPAAAIREIASSYLYRDVLEYQGVKHPDLLQRLLQALALQIGGEVSYNELARLIGIDKATVRRYVSLLERAFVIFHLPPFSRNLRKELGKLRKIYFHDLGVRNAIINNFNPLDMRADLGALWENFVISERLKFNHNRRRQVNAYFWRTHDGAEIDYLEERGGSLRGMEIKWRSKRWRVPAAFQRAYPEAKVELVDRERFLATVLEERLGE